MASENLNQSSVALTPVEATDYAESVAAYKAQKRPFLSFLSGISAGACIASIRRHKQQAQERLGD